MALPPSRVGTTRRALTALLCSRGKTNKSALIFYLLHLVLFFRHCCFIPLFCQAYSFLGARLIFMCHGGLGFYEPLGPAQRLTDGSAATAAGCEYKKKNVAGRFDWSQAEHFSSLCLAFRLPPPHTRDRSACCLPPHENKWLSPLAAANPPLCLFKYLICKQS